MHDLRLRREGQTRRGTFHAPSPPHPSSHPPTRRPLLVLVPVGPLSARDCPVAVSFRMYAAARARATVGATAVPIGGQLWLQRPSQGISLRKEMKRESLNVRLAHRLPDDLPPTGPRMRTGPYGRCCCARRSRSATRRSRPSSTTFSRSSLRSSSPSPRVSIRPP
jgi:hypothetical protein